MTMNQLIFSFLFNCLLLRHVLSQGLTMSSSLQATNRIYVCPGEVVTYVCSGSGNEILLFAPPHIPFSQAISYTTGDPPRLGGGAGPIVTSLIFRQSAPSPLLTADIAVQNSSLEDFSVHCRIGSEELRMEFRSASDSLPPLNEPETIQLEDNDIDDNTLLIRWDCVSSGRFDLNFYTVQINSDNGGTMLSIDVPPNTCNITTPFPYGITVNVRVLYSTACGQQSSLSMPSSLLLTRPPRSDTVIAFLVILSLAVISLVVALVITCCCLCKQSKK